MSLAFWAESRTINPNNNSRYANYLYNKIGYKSKLYSYEERMKRKARLFYKLSRKYPNGTRYYSPRTGKYEIWGQP